MGFHWGAFWIDALLGPYIWAAAIVALLFARHSFVSILWQRELARRERMRKTTRSPWA